VCIESVWPGRAGRCVFTGRDSDEKLHRFLQREGLRPGIGEVWDIEGGTPVIHQKYGPQITVQQARWVEPSGELIIHFLSRHEAFRGIGVGVARASALWEAFGDGLHDVLNEQRADLIASVERIPSDVIPRLLEAWKMVMVEAEIVRWLTLYGVPLVISKKLMEYFGKDAVDVIKANPYKLLAFCSWNKCEAVARQMGIRQDDPRRLIAIIQNCLYKNMDSGNTRMSCDHLIALAQKHFKKGRKDLGRSALTLAVDNEAVHCDGDWISTMGIRLLEVDAMQRFDELLSNPDSTQMELPLQKEEYSLNSAICAFEEKAGYFLNEAQCHAVEMATNHRFCLLTGGAGVGKTTVLQVLANLYRDNLFLAALTGQAAKRMTEATGKPASTIERFIRKIAPKIQGSPYVIIDEASMLDLVLTVRLLRALPSTARLMFVGDPEQLPPVSFGLIFHKLAYCPRVPQVELTIINRQSENSGIPHVSRQIRQGIVPAFNERGMVRFENIARSEVLEKLIDLKHDYPLAQILAPKNSGGLGVSDINSVFHKIHKPNRVVCSMREFSVGDPVIFKRNDMSLDLVNGSLGTILEVEANPEGMGRMIIDFSGEQKVIEEEHFEYLKLAYALTVHSAQGSQFDTVIIVLESSRILDRTWVYTALTRAVSRVVFVGDKDAFDRAVREAPHAHQRNVLFSLNSVTKETI